MNPKLPNLRDINMNAYQKGQDNQIKINNVAQGKIPTVEIVRKTSVTSNTSDGHRISQKLKGPEIYDKEELKWDALVKFWSFASKAQLVYDLKFQTLFQSYSMAEKTINLVVVQFMPFEYWIACCLYLSMKYEQIYPPCLRDLSIIVKRTLNEDIYFQNELKVLEFLQMDLNFIGLNHLLSEYVHIATQEERFFIFFMLEISLTQRKNLKKFTLKQLVVSSMYLLASRSIHIQSYQLIDGLKFSRIEECAKIIIINQTFCDAKQPFLFKKYKHPQLKSVSTKPLPIIESITSLLMTKIDQQEGVVSIIKLGQVLKRKTVAKVKTCDGLNLNQMIDQKNKMNKLDCKIKKFALNQAIR